MKAKIRTSLKKHANEIRFISIIIIFGLITGAIFYLKQSSTVKSSILLNMTDVFSTNVFSGKNIFIHIIILALLILSSFLAVGLIFTIVYIFIESLAIGFLIPLFINSFKLVGIWNFFVYFIFIKLLFLLLLILFFIAILKLTKCFLLDIKNRSSNYKLILKKVIIIFLLIVLNDIFIYFISNKIITFILV